MGPTCGFMRASPITPRIFLSNITLTKKQAQDYVIGCRELVTNDIPIIADYNVNARGSGDMYYKGGKHVAFDATHS